MDDIAEDGADAGMKSLLKGRKVTDGKKNGKGAADFELVDYEADAGEPLQGRETFPLSITLNLVCPLLKLLCNEPDDGYNAQMPTSNQPFLDATLFESYCSPTRLICSFDGQGNVRGVRQEIPDGSASAEPNEIPFNRLDGLIDVGQALLRGRTTMLISTA